ncbi:MAG: DUF1624 domain-containing protein [Candidatus Lokiarchaeota archaeon]|nr:DUF1624 domain-containing protein [Candidatus Lokiarchaeota archaeon]
MPAIDTLKGFSMLMMFHIHFAWAWRADDWFSLLRFEWYVTDFFGVATFLTMSLAGNMISLQARWETGDRSLFTRRKLLRLSFLYLIGELLNLMFLPSVGVAHLMIWNVLTGIAVFSLLLPLVMRLPGKARLLLAVALLLLYYPILDWSMGAMNSSGLTPDAIRLAHLSDPRTFAYFALFNHAMMMPLYPWLVVLLLTSIVFARITSPRAFRAGDLFKRELGRIAIVGAVLVAIGIAAGSGVMMDYDAKVFEELLVPSPYFTWLNPDGVFTFLIRHVPQSILYGTGIAYVWFAGIGWIQVVKGKGLPMQEKVNNIGRYSLTAYLLTHVAMFVPIKLPLAAFYIVFLPAAVAFVWGMWAWSRKYQGIGTLEFAMDMHARAISVLIDKRRAKRGG